MWFLKNSCLQSFGGSVCHLLYLVRVCLQMGFLAVGCLLGCAALLVHTQSCRVPTVPPRCGITAFHLSSRQQDKLFGLGFWVLGFFFFPVACGLLGFMHSKKARGGECVWIWWNLFACFWVSVTWLMAQDRTHGGVLCVVLWPQFCSS